MLKKFKNQNKINRTLANFPFTHVDLSETTEQNGVLKHTNGKNYLLRRRGNLTTFEGLDEFRKTIAERDGGKESDYDVIKYDYQLLDDAHWLLSQNGYKIIKRS